MKQALITTIITLGLTLGSFSTALASGGNLAIILQNPAGSRALNPQPEPPGVTEQTQSTGKLQLNPQPEPPGVTERTLSTSTAPCLKTAEDSRKMASATAKIAYDKAIQAAEQAKAKALAHAKTLTDKATKKAAILKAQSDFAAAQTKAREDKNSALKAATQAYKKAIEVCRNGGNVQR